MRQVFLFGLSALAICLSPMNDVQAAPVLGTQAAPVLGTQAFSDIGTPTADGSNTGNINTATTFTIGNLVSTTSNTGVFAGMPVQTFGSVTMVIPSPISQVLAFTTPVFDTFTSQSITEPINNPGFVNIVADGLWSPGTWATGMGLTGDPLSRRCASPSHRPPRRPGASPLAPRSRRSLPSRRAFPSRRAS